MRDADNLEEFMDNREERIAYAFMAIESKNRRFRYFRGRTPLKGMVFFVFFLCVFFVILLILSASS